MAKSSLERVKIVLVEDNPEIRLPVARFLKEKGADVQTGTDAAEGVTLVRKHDPDVVLLDLKMAGEKEFSGLRAIREVDQVKVRILVFTGAPLSRVSRKARSARVDGYLLKPFGPKELLDAVRTLLGE
jgi:two-component system OmpR family response regulator